MQQLWSPVPSENSFPTVAEWAQGLGRLRQEFDGGTGPFVPKLVEAAESLFADLLPSQVEPVLLHGDLHHWNILRATRAPWLALDPKGVVGEPAYEVGAWLRNPIDRLADWPNLKRIQARRIDQFAEMLSLDRQRLVGWGIAQAVLSAWWSYEDHGRVGTVAMACAESLFGML
jgi:streptomycin 6-kinase